jgi:hypothetical protein
MALKQRLATDQPTANQGNIPCSPGVNTAKIVLRACSGREDAQTPQHLEPNQP